MAAGLALAMLLLTSCASEGPAVPALVLDDSAGDDSVTLRWTYAGPLDAGFTLDVKEGDADWRILATGIPSGIRAQVIWLDPLPETTYAYRLTAYSTTAVSTPSNEVSHFWIRRPGVELQRIDPSLVAEGRHLVTWTRRTSLPVEERLERAVASADGTVGSWVPLPAAAGATSQDDPDLSTWVDGARHLYRIVSSFQGHEVPSRPVQGEPGPLAAPGPVSAQVDSDGRVILQWVNRSRYAASIRVSREGRDLGSFPVGTTTAVDALLPGLYSYWFQPVPDFQHGPPVTGGGGVRLPVVALPSPRAGPLVASAVTLPEASAAIRTAAGDFAVVAQAPGAPGTGSVFTPAGPRWAAHGLGEARFFEPPLLLDGSGAIHALYFAGQSSGSTYPVRHVWIDSLGLHDEPVHAGPGTSYYPGMAAIAQDGTLRAAWRDGGTTAVASNVGGAWGVEVLTPSDGARAMGLAVAPSGTSHLVLCTGTGACEHWSRAPLGTWAAEPMPPSQAGTVEGSRLLAPGNGEAVLAFDAYDSVTGFEAWALERGPQGWGAPLRLGAGRVCAAAGSPDGKRVAVAGAANPTSRLFLRDAGVWQDLPLLLAANSGSVSLGFTPQGRVWALEGLGPPDGAPSGVYLLDEEP